jgi:hypothetical protein
MNRQQFDSVQKFTLWTRLQTWFKKRQLPRHLSQPDLSEEVPVNAGDSVTRHRTLLPGVPLSYYPGSHRWATYTNEHITAHKHDLRRPASQAIYEGLWRELVATFRCEREVFLPRRGQALIWTACLLHGGEPILDRSKTRWSQVTHYFFHNCAYYTPMASHVMAGKIAFRNPLNVFTKQSVSSLYAEQPIADDYLAQCQQRQLLAPGELSIEPLPEDFDPARYLVLHPDVAEAGVDPVDHYLTYGRYEGRPYK